MVDILDAITSMPLNVEGLKPLENRPPEIKFDPRTDIPQDMLDYLRSESFTPTESINNGKIDPALIYSYLFQLGREAEIPPHISKEAVLESYNRYIGEGTRYGGWIQKGKYRNVVHLPDLFSFLSTADYPASPDFNKITQLAINFFKQGKKLHFEFAADLKSLDPEAYDRDDSTVVNLSIFTSARPSLIQNPTWLGSQLAAAKIIHPERVKNLNIRDTEWEAMKKYINDPTQQINMRWKLVRDMSIISAPRLIFRNRAVFPDFTADPDEIISSHIDQPLPPLKKY